MHHYMSLVLSKCLQVSLPSKVIAPKVFCLGKLSEKEFNGAQYAFLCFVLPLFIQIAHTHTHTELY